MKTLRMETLFDVIESNSHNIEYLIINLNLRFTNKVTFSRMINTHNLSFRHFQINVKSITIRLLIIKF